MTVTAVFFPVRILIKRQIKVVLFSFINQLHFSGADLVVQQVRGVVRGPFGAGQRWVGPIQLCHPCKFLGKTLMVPWTHL